MWRFCSFLNTFWNLNTANLILCCCSYWLVHNWIKNWLLQICLLNPRIEKYIFPDSLPSCRHLISLVDVLLPPKLHGSKADSNSTPEWSDIRILFLSEIPFLNILDWRIKNHNLNIESLERSGAAHTAWNVVAVVVIAGCRPNTTTKCHTKQQKFHEKQDKLLDNSLDKIPKNLVVTWHFQLSRLIYFIKWFM